MNEQEIFEPKLFYVYPDGRQTPITIAQSVQKLPEGVTLCMEVDWRTPKSTLAKINPLWWVTNDWDTAPPDWSMSGYPQWLRVINWWFRNPFHNFGRYVLGVGDRNYKVCIYRRDGYDFNTADLQGWEQGYILMEDGLKLPWFAYGSNKAVFYYGWQPTGFAGFKLNKWALLAAPIAPVLFFALVVTRLMAEVIK